MPTTWPGSGPDRPLRFSRPVRATTAAVFIAPTTPPSGPTLLANPAWPATDVQVDFTTGPPSYATGARLSINAQYHSVAVRAFHSDRGRQYELDQCQAGQLTLDVTDPLEYLNPDNTGSPFNQGANTVTTYRVIWLSAMWPNQPGSGNIINPTVNSAYDPSFASGLGLWAAAGGATTVALSALQHNHGSQSMRVGQSAAGVGFGAANSFRTMPGFTYTFSVYVMPTAGCSVTTQVVDATGAVTSSATTSQQNTWVRLSFAWTAEDTLETITIYGTGVAAPVFFVDAVQLEFGATTTPFTTTGPTLYSIFSGYVERWPTTYDSCGFRALKPLQAVDALAILSQTQINQSYPTTIKADAPTVYAPLSNAKSATSGGALSTGSETAVIGSSTIRGNPIYTVSPTGSINWAGDSQPDGEPAVVFNQQNANKPPVPGGADQDTYLDVLSSSLSFDTQAGGVMEVWARPVSGGFMVGGLLQGPSGTATNYSFVIPQIAIERYPSGGITFVYDYDGAHAVVLSGPAGSPQFVDNNWHYYAVTLKAGGMKVMVDGAESGSTPVTTPGRIGFNILCHLSANTGFGDPNAQVSVGRWAVYTTDIGFARRLAHYQRGAGYIGEVSGARVTRLLTQYWAGPFTVSNGFAQLSPDFHLNTMSILAALQEVQETERGLLYVTADGTIKFEDRTARYLNQTALWVFGEQELPYEDYASDHDPTYVFSQANLTRPGNSNFAPIVNAATQDKYGQRILPQEVQVNNDFDLYQAGIYYTSHYSAPMTRVSKLVLNPAANPTLWPALLSLEISQRIRVNRRSGGFSRVGDYYVEKITHTANPESGEWLVELQISPVANPTVWVLGDATYGVLGSTSIPVYYITSGRRSPTVEGGRGR